MTAKKPKISIITINYNNDVGLQQTIESVIKQSYKDVEYLIIDGASTDGSVKILEKFKGNISQWISEADNGIYNAMNKGIKFAKGEYLLFLNSGDVLASDDAIEKVATSGVNTDLIIANMVFVKDGIKRPWVLEEKLTFGLFYFQGIPHPSTFVKKDLFETVGLYDESLTIVSDWKFFLLAVCKFNCSYKHVNILVTEFDENGMSSDPANIPKILAERNKVMKENFPAFLSDYEELWAAKKQLRRLRYTIKIKKFLGIR